MLKRTLVVLMMAGTVTGNAQQQQQPSHPQTPSAAVIPMDLSLYTPAELRIFKARCDSEVAAALTRGDTNSAEGWARVRAEIDVRLAPVPAAPRLRQNREKEKLPPGWYANHVKVWDEDGRHWHYEPITKKIKPSIAILPTPSPESTPIPTPTPTPTEQTTTKEQRLDELIRQYKQTYKNNP